MDASEAQVRTPAAITEVSVLTGTRGYSRGAASVTHALTQSLVTARRRSLLGAPPNHTNVFKNIVGPETEDRYSHR